MDTTLILSIAGIAFLLLCSGFFSAAETALTAVSRGRMHQLEKDGSRAAHHVNILIGSREKMIGAVLLGNTFINILSSSLATSLLEDHLGNQAVAVATGLMTLAILVFSEVLPKTLAIVRTDKVALAVAVLLRGIVFVLAPIVAAVQYVVWKLLWLFGLRDENAVLVEVHEELRGTVDLHHREGTMEREHRDMIAGVLDLRELSVSDIMIHRKNMVTVDADAPADEILAAVLDTNHTRVPIWRDQPENIIGMLHTKDIARAYMERRDGEARVDIVALATPPWFVPDTTTLEEQLAAFREQRTHFALVVDEYGALQGLVTLEDILEEIFGAIPDEQQARKERPGVRLRPDGSYLIDGAMSVRDLNRELEWNLPVDEATTIAGLVIHEARTIPNVGQRFGFFGYKFEILRRQRNQITAIRVIPPSSQNDMQPG
jgi:Mg2+/Co2+ transporter CorB